MKKTGDSHLYHSSTLMFADRLYTKMGRPTVYTTMVEKSMLCLKGVSVYLLKNT